MELPAAGPVVTKRCSDCAHKRTAPSESRLHQLTGLTSRRALRRAIDGLGQPDLNEAMAEIAPFAGVTEASEIEQRLQAQVVDEVQAISKLVDEADAFDVIELMRMREMPIAPELALEPGFDGSGAVIELIALILLSRGTRKPCGVPRVETRPHEAVEELHSRAKRLIRLATYRAKAWELVRGGEPLDRLSAEYQSYLVGVRNLQYELIQAAHEQALFNRPEMDRLPQTHLGFTYEDFVATRKSIYDRHCDGMARLRDITGDIVLTTNAEERDPTAEEIETFQSAMIDFMFLPGDRAAFTTTDISDQCHLDADVVDRVLQLFSLPFDSAIEATKLVNDFLHAQSPLSRRGLVRAGGSYLTVSGPIGADSFRVVVEDALKNTKGWDRYDETRCLVSESIATDALTNALATPPLAANLKHFGPRKDHGPESLDQECVDPTAVGELVEADSLFIVDDVAVCLEVKARSVAEPARRGDVARLRSEIKKILGDGARQARRLETLLRTNGGYWDENCNWIDLGHVREAHTIVAGLDYFGPLGVALGDLADAELLGQGDLPWIVSLHDLETVYINDRPEKNPEIDELVARAGLKPIRDRPHPVSAKKRQRRARRGR